MTPQEIFNRAYLGILKQGAPGRGRVSGCTYMSYKGHMCGIGHVIGEDRAQEWVEQGYDTVDTVSDEDLPDYLHDNLGLAVDLQRAHDLAEPTETYFIDDFKHRMARVADNHQLEVPAT